MLQQICMYRKRWAMWQSNVFLPRDAITNAERGIYSLHLYSS